MLDVIILAIVQGIAEFLPISSSAHLIIFREVFKIGATLDESILLTFDVALHFGTLLAIIIYFFDDLIKLLIDGLFKPLKTANSKLFWCLILATVPAALVGVLFEDVIDNFFRKQTILIGVALIVMGIIIYIVDKKFKDGKEIKDLTFKESFLVGCAQVFALIPGFSRSGTTISASRVIGLNKEDSAKFSFYLAIPVILGGTLYSLIKPGALEIVINNLDIFGIGILISFLTGLVCIAFLLKYIRKHDFKVFMIYRIIMGLVVILYCLM